LILLMHGANMKIVLQNVKNFRARNSKWDITRWIVINIFISQCSSDLMLVELPYISDYKYHPRHILLHALFIIQQLLQYSLLINRLKPVGTYTYGQL
jgi:hypothetical protein